MERTVSVLLLVSNISHTAVRSGGITVTQQDKLLKPDCPDRHPDRQRGRLIDYYTNSAMLSPSPQTTAPYGGMYERRQLLLLLVRQL